MKNKAETSPLIFHPSIDGQEILAPRGVAVCGNILVVSDTGQNRVLIWHNFSFDFKELSNPSIVLGQSDFANCGRNNGGLDIHASSMQYPSGVWTDGTKLIVADAWNHRVLIWHNFPSINGQPADVVVGQKDFNSNQPNIDGLSKAPCAESLYWPYGVCSDGKSLWIADTGNRRVLYYEDIPQENFCKADKVIGQDNLNEKDYNPQNAIWPYSVKINSNNALAITDTQYYRTLVWKNKDRAFDSVADVILGQPDFDSNGQNQYRPFPKANTLNWCYDNCFYKDGILVADTGNSRILYWDKIPEANNGAASAVFGQPDFESLGEASLSLKNDLKTEMYWPFAITVFHDHLIVADTGNHRILNYKL